MESNNDIFSIKLALQNLVASMAGSTFLFQPRKNLYTFLLPVGGAGAIRVGQAEKKERKWLSSVVYPVAMNLPIGGVVVGTSPS
jgi:hypothetical protein